MQLPTRRNSIVSTILILMSLFAQIPSAHSREDFIDYHGLTLFYGRSAWTNIGPSNETPYEWTHISYVLGKNIAPWISLETHIGPGYLATDLHGSTPSLEARILANFHYKFFFIKIGGGMAHLFDAGNLPGLADSNIHGIVSGSTGLEFSFDRGSSLPIILTLGYGVEHISAPNKDGEDGDEGWNTGGAKIAVNWPF